MRRILVPITLSLVLAACSTTQLDAQWTNPAYAGRSLRGAPVLVVCEAQELTLQRICEDQVTGQIVGSLTGCTRDDHINKMLALEYIVQTCADLADLGSLSPAAITTCRPPSSVTRTDVASFPARIRARPRQRPASRRAAAAGRQRPRR